MCNKRESEMNVMSDKVKKVKLVEIVVKERRASTFKFTLTKENKEYLRTLETIVE
jgi:hypothetical protein